MEASVEGPASISYAKVVRKDEPEAAVRVRVAEAPSKPEVAVEAVVKQAVAADLDEDESFRFFFYYRLLMFFYCLFTRVVKSCI